MFPAGRTCVAQGFRTTCIKSCINMTRNKLRRTSLIYDHCCRNQNKSEQRLWLCSSGSRRRTLPNPTNICQEIRLIRLCFSCRQRRGNRVVQDSTLNPVCFSSTVPGLHAGEGAEGNGVYAGRLCQNEGKAHPKTHFCVVICPLARSVLWELPNTTVD